MTSGTSTVAYDQTLTGCASPVTTSTNEVFNTRRSCTDGLGRLAAITEPDPATGSAGTVTSYTYDMLNNLSAVDSSVHAYSTCALPGSSTTHMRCFAYSTLSRLVSATNPESGTVSYVYDGNGNVTQRTDAINNVTSINGYDKLNRPASISYTVTGTTAATPTVTYGYDQDFKGALSSVANSVSTTSLTHDAFGRVITNMQTTGSNGPYTFHYGYSLTDVLTSMTYPSGRQITYGLDAADRVTSVQNVGTGWNYAALTYKASGAVNSLSTHNGVSQTFSWNDRVQPTGVTVTGASQSTLLTLGFYPCANQATSCASANNAGNNGNMQSQTISLPGLSVTQNYSYDHLNRLTGAKETGGGPGWSQAYSFDALGNRWIAPSANVGLPALTQETPQDASWYVNANGTTVPNRIYNSWTYDAAGNVLTVGGVTRSFTYDAENRQVTANLNGAVSGYAYDGSGLRVSKTSGGQTTVYVYDAWGDVAAEYPTQAPASPCGTSTCYVTVDSLGSTRMLTDANGSSTVTRYDYQPFGQEILAGVAGRLTSMGYLSAADATNPKYTGQMRDSETGLDWFQVRHMSGAQGRFQSVDPGNAGADAGDPQSWNGYSYVGNNPMSFTDPSGLFLEATGIGAAVGGPPGAAVGAAIDIGIALAGLFQGIFGGGGAPSTIAPSLVTPGSLLLVPWGDDFQSKSQSNRIYAVGFSGAELETCWRQENIAGTETVRKRIS